MSELVVGVCGDCGGPVVRDMEAREVCQSCGAQTARSALPVLPMLRPRARPQRLRRPLWGDVVEGTRSDDDA